MHSLVYIYTTTHATLYLRILQYTYMYIVIMIKSRMYIYVCVFYQRCMVLHIHYLSLSDPCSCMVMFKYNETDFHYR